MKGLIGKLGGRKFIVAIVGLVAVIVDSLTGWDLTPHKEMIIGILGSYLIGQGVADGLSKGATATTTDETKSVG